MHLRQQALRIEGLRKAVRSGATELVLFENLSFAVGRGEMLAIVGQSGAGKSTLFHILGALGFFMALALEWVPVVASAFGASFLAVAMVQPNAPVLRACLVVLGLQAAVGVVGFGLHALSDLHRPGSGLWERVIHGAQVFAPLLFADIAVLGALDIWGLMRHPAAEAAAQRAPTT